MSSSSGRPAKLPESLELLISDINGVPRGKTIDSTAIDGGELQHFPKAILLQTINGSYCDAMETLNAKDDDLLLKPDWSTYRSTPWKKQTGQLICETINKDTGRPISFDSRNVLKQLVQQFGERDMFPIVAPELEFYLLEPNKKDALELSPAIAEDGSTEAGGEAFSPDSLDKYSAIIDDLNTLCAKAGLATSALVHEMGPAQIELNVEHGDVMDRIDQLFLLKRLVKACAVRHGKLASFMAKPMAGQAGNGLHTHCSMVNADGNNVFALENGQAPLALKHFIGGLQIYLPKIFALIAPNINSYRRFVPGLSAPINLEWGYDNRTTGLRVPFGPDAAGRIENRVAGADANPYLLMAANLACGLLGMHERIEPTAAHEGDAYDEAADLPEHLYPALTALENCEPLVALLGSDFVEAFVSAKRSELSHFGKHVSPWEVTYLGNQL
ncbi:MAG: glutamine synthetase family protein [Pseudomonadota bacterium]